MVNKFVVWGTGFRAEALFSLVDEYIVVFIDNDTSKQNKQFLGKRVISFEEYMQNYKEYPIIVSPTYVQKEICKQLEENGIEDYLLLQKNPPEFFGYGTSNIWEYVLPNLSKEKRNVLVGDNLYTLLLYQKAVELGLDSIICCLDWFSESFIHLLEKMDCKYCGIDGLRDNDNVLTCLPRKMYENGTNIFDLSNCIEEYWHKEMCDVKDTHTGETCFIVATGPSLKAEDLSVLRANNVFSFSVNRIFEMPDALWTPDCYVFTDKKGIIDYSEQISQYNVPLKILTDAAKNEVNITGNVKYIHVVGTNDYAALPEFSEDVSKQVYGFATVTYAVLQIAVYMGFKQIFLLGVDCNYTKGSSNNYFSKTKEADNLDHHTNQMVQAYMAAKEYADTHGIKIYNATRGGMLEVFERVDFDSIFEG